MKNKYLLLASAAMLGLFAMPASAHNGEHSDGIMANLVHYITQPTHLGMMALGAIIGFFIVRALKPTKGK